MKRITAFILALVLVLSLGGCRKAADPRAELPEETKQALNRLLKNSAMHMKNGYNRADN